MNRFLVRYRPVFQQPSKIIKDGRVVEFPATKSLLLPMLNTHVKNSIESAKDKEFGFGLHFRARRPPITKLEVIGML